MELKIVSFNLKNTRIPYLKNHWKHRVNAVRAFFDAEAPDVVGTQELSYANLVESEAILPQYGWVGEGRNGGQRGEYTAIFYNKSRLRVLDWGVFWLSRTPDKPSRSWFSFFRRTCTWALFESREDGSTFRVYNTHLDHVSVLARLEGLRIIRAHMAGHRDCVLMGDFNAKPGSKAISQLCADDMMEGVQRIADRVELREWAQNGRTYHGFGGKVAGRPIDYIFATDSMPVMERYIHRQMYFGRHASDHYPVIMILRTLPAA